MLSVQRATSGVNSISNKYRIDKCGTQKVRMTKNFNTHTFGEQIYFQLYIQILTS